MVIILILNKNNFMFTKGQWIFALLFAITFILVLVYSYKKDSNLHKKFFAGSIWVLIAFIAFILMIVSIKLIFIR